MVNRCCTGSYLRGTSQQPLILKGDSTVDQAVQKCLKKQGQYYVIATSGNTTFKGFFLAKGIVGVTQKPKGPKASYPSGAFKTGREIVLYRAVEGQVQQVGAYWLLKNHNHGPEISKKLWAAEIRKIQRLSSTNLIAVYQSHFSYVNHRHQEKQACVVEKFDGDFQTVVSRAPSLTEQERLEWARSLLKLVHALHSQGYIHRELKPANILVRQEKGAWKVVLGDLGGLVSWPTPTEENLISLQCVAAPDYLAPECAQLILSEAWDKLENKLSYTIDTFALGVMLYELMAPCYRWPSAQHLLHQGRTNTLEWRRQFTELPDTPPCGQAAPMWGIIAGLLKKNPQERLALAEAVENLKKCTRL